MRVEGPSKGLLTRPPSDQAALPHEGKHIILSQNIRAEKGALKNSPGVERVGLKIPAESATAITSEATLVHQPALVSSDVNAQTSPVIGTADRLYAVSRGSRTLSCPTYCTLTFAAVANSGSTASSAQKVASMVRAWNPDVLIHAGDAVSSDGGGLGANPYTEQLGLLYGWAAGGYNGASGGVAGPAENELFPCPGERDYSAGPLLKYQAFFGLPARNGYYTVKRGPVQFFFVDSWGYGPASTGPGGSAINGTGAAVSIGNANLSSSTGPQAVWLQAALAASDCPWRVVVWHHPPRTSDASLTPGYAVMDWPLGTWGADVLLTGHSTAYERIERSDGVTQISVGSAGYGTVATFGASVTGSAARFSGGYGAVKVAATQTSFTFQFFDLNGIQQDLAVKTTARSYTTCYLGGVAKTPQTLVVKPSAATAPPGVQMAYRAFAVFGDGTSEEVTARSTWTSSSTDIATVSPVGIAKGAKAGSTTITAAFLGLTATATLTITAPCVGTVQDIAIVYTEGFASEGAGLNPWAGEGTWLDVQTAAAAQLLATLHTGDQVVSVSSYGTLSGTPTSTIYHRLTADFSKARAVFPLLAPRGLNAVAAGVDAAVAQLAKDGRKNVPKFIVMFTPWWFPEVATGCSLSGSSQWTCCITAITTAVNKAKAAGIKVVVFSLGGVTAIFSGTPPAGDWNGWPYTWASCPSFYYSVGFDDPDQYAAAAVRIRNDVCFGVCGGSSGTGIGLGGL